MIENYFKICQKCNDNYFNKYIFCIQKNMVFGFLDIYILYIYIYYIYIYYIYIYIYMCVCVCV